MLMITTNKPVTPVIVARSSQPSCSVVKEKSQQASGVQNLSGQWTPFRKLTSVVTLIAMNLPKQ